MKHKKVLSLMLTFALSFSMLVGCGNNASNTTQSTDTKAASTEAENTETESNESTDAADATDTDSETEAADQEAEANQLLVDLTGTYQELWPVILADEYTQTWIDDCAELVGEDNAQAAFDKLSSMVTGELYGEEAVEAYADGNGVYDCSFTQDLDTIEFDGSTSTIKGYDAAGNELFSHTYHYVGMEDVRGLYEYESDDADSGEFTYFCIGRKAAYPAAAVLPGT